MSTRSLGVIPDIHMRRSVFAHAQRLSGEGHDLVFLGDYVNKSESGNDPVLLKEIFALAQEHGSTLLVGNHDLGYLFPDRPELRTSKYEPANAKKISGLYHRYDHRFKFIHRVGNYLFSHAGLSAQFVRAIEERYGISNLDELIAFVNTEQPPELFYHSRITGGGHPFSGPLWLRLPQYEQPMFTERNILQVIGHTSQPCIRMKYNLLMIDVELPLLLEW